MIECPLPHRSRIIPMRYAIRRVDRVNIDGTWDEVSRYDAIQRVAVHLCITVREAEAYVKKNKVVSLPFCVYHF